MERMTITLPSDMVAIVKGEVKGGDDTSISEVVRAAFRDWEIKRPLQRHELTALKADIDLGLADVAAGRVKEFDAAQIINRGRERLAHSSSV